MAEQTQGVNIALTPGAVTESVTVSAANAPAIQTENADVEGTLTTREAEGLPQIGRDPYELLRLAPGVFGLGARDGSGNSVGLPNTTGPGGSNKSIFQTENQVPISANGQRLSANNYMIDGVTVDSQNWGGAAVVTPNQESVNEITVHSEAYDAQYGRNSGAQIEVVSKSGTNQLHGSGFFQFQDPNLNAYNKYGGPFDAPPVRVDTRFRQYGGSVGAPIVKDKLFFFFSYEGLTNKTDTPYEAWVETSQYRAAVISAYPNSIAAQVFSSPGIAPRAVSVLNVPCSSSFAPGTCQQVSGGLNIGSITGATGQYVDINKNPTGGGLNGVPDIQYDVLAAPSVERGNQYNARGDYLLNSNNTIALSTYLTPLSGTEAQTASQSRPMADLPITPFNSAYFLSYGHVFSPTLFNEVRANFTRFAYNQIAGSSEVNWGIPELQIQNIPGVDNNIQFGAPQASTTPAIFAQNTYEFNDTLHQNLGRHALKYGLVVRKMQNNDNLAGGARPVYTFQGPWNFANDTPIYEAINASPETGAPAPAQHYLRDGDYGVFVQDDFKLRPNLTLNFGLRWEYFSPRSDAQGQLSNAFFGPGSDYNTSYIKLVGQLYNPDYHNFAPRIGLAWSPTGNRKLVVRAGYGWYYNEIPGVVFENVFQDPPNFASYGICCGTATTSFGTPFANGQILYALGSSNSPFSYPVNPALATGIDPTTNAPRGPSNPNAPQVQVYMAQQNMVNPFVQVYSFDLQYELPWKLVATAGYGGSEARHQIRLVNESFLYPTGPLFPFTQVYSPQPDVNPNFNALLVTLARRLTSGFQFTANYRWSKSLDTLSYEGPGFVTNQTYPQNQATEYGPSDFDVPQYFNFSTLYELPFYKKQEGFLGHLLGGFNISAIVTASSGFPWTPVTCGAAEATPGGQTRCPIRPIEYLGGAGHSTSNAPTLTALTSPRAARLTS